MPPQSRGLRYHVDMNCSDDQKWTFREIDFEFGRTKGAAFRAFKYAADLDPEHDFELLDTWQDAERIKALKEAGRAYRTTVNAVLLTPSGYQKIRRDLITSPN